MFLAKRQQQLAQQTDADDAQMKDDNEDTGFTLSDDDASDAEAADGAGDDTQQPQRPASPEFFLDQFGHQTDPKKKLKRQNESVLEYDKNQQDSIAEVYLALSKQHAAWQDTHNENVGIRIRRSDDDFADAAEASSNDAMNDEEDDGEFKIVSGNAYEQRMRRFFVKMQPLPKWAWQATQQSLGINLDGAQDGQHQELDSILRRTDAVVDTSSHLPRGQLSYALQRDLNDELKHAKVRSIDFHPRANVALVHYANGNVALFQVDGVSNKVVMQLENSVGRMHRTKFSADGKEIVQSTGHGFFYVFDLEKASVKRIPLPRVTGADAGVSDELRNFDVSPDNELIAFCSTNGYIRLVSMKTKFAVGYLKLHKQVNDAAFSSDGKMLYSVGKGGQLILWDMTTRRPLRIIKDEGSINTTCVCASRDGKYVATGSASGVVNIYLVESLLAAEASSEATVKPLGTVTNLTTSVDLLQFNVDSQILAIASSEKTNSIRLVHLPSFSVFSNWPAVQGAGFIEPQSMCFSSSSGYFAVASTNHVFLYRLNYYKML